MSTLRRWMIMLCLCLSGGVIYLLPYLREIYYLPMQEALHLNNTQLGVLMSVFGVTAMISYFPGGWLADKVGPKRLITISMISTGLAGLYFATFPSYRICIAVHAFWGVSVTFTFWAALIKTTRNWAPSTQQGRAFGILESGRGVAGVITSTALLALFAKLGSEAFGLSWVIVMFSIMDILIGIMAWFVLEDSKPGPADRPEEGMKIGAQDILKVIKMPVTWLIALIMLTAYSAYWGSYYFTPYATDVFMMSVVFGGALGIGKGFMQISALGAGLLADRIGASKTIAWSFIILIISFGVFVVTPGGPSLVFILVVNTVIASIAIFALRGVYFATFEEVGMPLAVTGTAVGVVSVIGFTPDIFIPLVGGALLDRYPGPLGYRYFFLFISGLCFLGLLATLVLMRKYIKKRTC